MKSDAHARQEVIRSPYLLLKWHDDVLVLTDTSVGRRFRCSNDILSILERASTPMTITDHAKEAAVSVKVIERLVNDRILVRPSDLPETYWTPEELAVQRLSGFGHVRLDIDWKGMPPIQKRSGETRRSLPLGPGLQIDLEEALRSRRSCRRFSTQPISETEHASLLRWSTKVRHVDESQGVSLRNYASGGARHPLEIYTLTLNVAGLDRSVYRYDAIDETLISIQTDPIRIPQLLDELKAFTGGSLQGAPAAIFFITAVFARTMWKYENMGLSLVYKEAGCLIQNLYLVTAALGLGGCAIAGARETVNARWLGLDPIYESQVAGFMVGMPSEKDLN